MPCLGRFPTVAQGKIRRLVNRYCNDLDIKLVLTTFKLRKLFSDGKILSRENSVHVLFTNLLVLAVWLWNSSKFFVVCYCSVFWPWPCTKNNSCLLRTEELAKETYWLRNSCIVYNKRLCRVVELPTWILASLFAPLMFAGLHNHSPLLTMSGADPDFSQEGIHL